MLKINPKCKVCVAVQDNKQLENAIFNTAFYLKNSHKSLKSVSDQYPTEFTYESLQNHVKRHQFMSDSDFRDRSLSNIKKKSREIQAERKLGATDVWDEVIDEGMNRLQAGELHLKASDLLKATKDKSDYELKVKDQQLSFMNMVYYYASGENNESKNYDRRIVEGKAVKHLDPSDTVTADSGQRAPGPSGIHYPPAWDASPPGATEVS